MQTNTKAFSNLIIEVFRLNRLLLEAGDALTAPLGLTSARWQVLGIVEHGPATVAQVARAMGLTRQSVQETATALAAAGFLEFVDNPQHRRARLMRITPEAAARMERLAVVQRAWAERVSDARPAQALGTVVAELRMLGALLEADIAAGRTVDDQASGHGREPLSVATTAAARLEGTEHAPAAALLLDEVLAEDRPALPVTLVRALMQRARMAVAVPDVALACRRLDELADVPLTAQESHDVAAELVEAAELRQRMGITTEDEG